MTLTANDLAGSLTWSDDKSICSTAIVERMAIHNGTVEYLSLVTTVAEFKAIRAGLNSQSKIPMEFEGIVLKRGESSDNPGYARTPSRATGSSPTASASGRSTPSASPGAGASSWTAPTRPSGRLRAGRPVHHAALTPLADVPQAGADPHQSAQCGGSAAIRRNLTPANDADSDAIVESGLQGGHITIEE